MARRHRIRAIMSTTTTTLRHYSFYDHVGLKIVRASDIDNEMREFFNRPPDDKDYSPEFQEMIDIAFESLNGGFIDSVKLIDNMEKRNIPPKILDYYFNLLRCKYIFFKREG